MSKVRKETEDSTETAYVFKPVSGSDLIKRTGTDGRLYRAKVEIPEEWENTASKGKKANQEKRANLGLKERKYVNYCSSLHELAQCNTCNTLLLHIGT